MRVMGGDFPSPCDTIRSGSGSGQIVFAGVIFEPWLLHGNCRGAWIGLADMVGKVTGMGRD